MKLWRKLLPLGGGVVILVLAVTVIVFFRPANDGRSPAERRQIAEACLGMLRSSLTNEVDLKPDDPRVPEVIRNDSP